MVRVRIRIMVVDDKSRVVLTHHSILHSVLVCCTSVMHDKHTNNYNYV